MPPFASYDWPTFPYGEVLYEVLSDVTTSTYTVRRCVIALIDASAEVVSATTTMEPSESVRVCRSMPRSFSAADTVSASTGISAPSADVCRAKRSASIFSC
ncbi:hypothetical protein ACFPRL_27075 [Pseudoclavibacter helvolus]